MLAVRGFKSWLGRMMDAMDELTREFLIESQEGLDKMEHCLIRPGGTAAGCGFDWGHFSLGAHHQGNHRISWP